MSTEEFNIPQTADMTEEQPKGGPEADLQAQLAALTDERDKLLNNSKLKSICRGC